MALKAFLRADSKKSDSATLTDMVMAAGIKPELKLDNDYSPNPLSHPVDQPSGLYKRNKPF